ncbi:MAG: esterase [Burkholderiaceae bacterium]|nr:esterase [Burkholderiaceae bacterium]
MNQKMLICIAALAAAGCATTDGFQVKEVGSFHAGGTQVSLSGLTEREIRLTPSAPVMKVNPNGEFETGQLYVQYVNLVAPQARNPLLMWHGGGLTGVTWETKPDGAPGWQQYFLKQGHDVYVSDAVERGRASWSRYPEIFTSEPFFRPKHEAWEGFRIGPSYHANPAQRVAYPGGQFPIQAFDQFTKQAVPRWATNNAATQAAYDALVARVCPCVIIVHSQGSAFAMQAALNAPGKIKGIVAVEPGGAPDPAKSNLSLVKNIPHLFVWGDNLLQNEGWGKLRVAPDTYRAALLARGGTADLLDLPAQGIRGNSHMLMMDRNSDQVAARIQAWMAANGLMK